MHNIAVQEVFAVKIFSMKGAGAYGLLRSLRHRFPAYYPSGFYCLMRLAMALE